MLLHNRVNGKELKQKLQQSQEPRTTLSFYRYVRIDDPAALRDELYAQWMQWRVWGRVYVAQEGINAQVSVPTEHFEAYRDAIYQHPYLGQLRLNVAVEDDGKSFFKLAIKVRPKIVADGLNDTTFDVTNKGQHLSAEAFNRIAEDPNTIIVDMRNHYEAEVGHFEGAIRLDADSFRDALPMAERELEGQQEKNVVMYCTGGIRCEKASAYFKHKGYKNVFQLEGGIIKYAHEVQEKGLPNKFRGKNFVFDERLGERVGHEVISHCHQCGAPCDTHTNCDNTACNLLFIQCEACAAQYEGCCSDTCQEVTHLPEEEQQKIRQQQPAKTRFSKGRLTARPTVGDQ
ncbi:UPF0176 protein [Catalinimonas alkaloidigena]|uniref:tRNA uridine(34) hydroxylase n=1 Tax=Catalinimonas alkaloidigena TaxID=1075417 RepID=A0A1G9R5C1_9BACT|nr:rhodanese-related sulfurtransferase [Catalinimonas alkaloidigena]SDM18444.1 UPF0176 protein [Catalinimonas alkaloidigena]